jgi:NAD(P)-dependent dehydrogenase (short-subunit alcohol dehydrogenase family)
MSTAVVLGASSGVGYHIAHALKSGPWPREVIGFHRGHYQSGARNLRHNGVMMLEADCGTMYSDVGIAIELLEQNAAANSIGLVVHSITGASTGSVIGSSPLAIEKTFNRLAHSYLWWAQGLLKTNLLAKECVFLALTNPCPSFFLSNTGVIGAAKAALEAYVVHLGCELGLNHQLRFVGLRFSTVLTPALEKVLPQAAIYGLSRLHNAIQPQGRMQTGEDIGELVRAITSPDARWLNGTIVDGTGGAPAMLMDYAFRAAAK